MLVSLKRVIRAGIIGFFRNTFVSVSTMLVMAITLFVIGLTLFMNGALTSTLEQVKNKVDINAYFVTDASEQDILDIKKRLEQMPEVASVKYTSRDEALAKFKSRHSGDQLILQALDELGDNPLGASLSIMAKDPSQYEVIAKSLEGDKVLDPNQKTLIERINYRKNKVIIDRLTNLTKAIERAGLVFTIILILASVMIVFNTIRLAIYTNKDEIEVMQLVGASNWFVRGPYIIEGMLYGLVAGLFTLLIFYPLSVYLASITESFFGSFNSYTFYIDNFGMLFEYIVGSGIILGAVSAYLSVRRYLKV